MNSKKNYKIYLIGVGGQGTIKTAMIISEAAMLQGLNVVMSEVHGMAQRGGTVVTEVKIGRSNSPLIEQNSADLILAFEFSEILRALSRIGKNTKVIVSYVQMIPFTVSLGISEYPDEAVMLDQLNQEIDNLYLIDAEKIAREAGHIITANIVILGAATAIPDFPVKKEFIMDSIGKNLPVHTLDMNKKALEMGYKEFISIYMNKNKVFNSLAKGGRNEIKSKSAEN
ncbi:MAG: indolepyruvate oxidoreductase subunit beta [Candidatus Atribacteria bacterium]|nr:indolepyruvate oxidoreductase subunit beta [Candidatus Atribacteria bacterium]